MCRSQDFSLDLRFDDFEQTTQLLRERLGVSSWDHLWTGCNVTPNAKQSGPCQHCPESAPQKVIASSIEQQKLEGGMALANPSPDEDVSAFSSETQALLRQLQAVKL